MMMIVKYDNDDEDDAVPARYDDEDDEMKGVLQK